MSRLGLNAGLPAQLDIPWAITTLDEISKSDSATDSLEKIRVIVDILRSNAPEIQEKIFELRFRNFCADLLSKISKQEEGASLLARILELDGSLLRTNIRRPSELDGKIADGDKLADFVQKHSRRYDLFGYFIMPERSLTLSSSQAKIKVFVDNFNIIFENFVAILHQNKVDENTFPGDATRLAAMVARRLTCHAIENPLDEQEMDEFLAQKINLEVFVQQTSQEMEEMLRAKEEKFFQYNRHVQSEDLNFLHDKVGNLLDDQAGNILQVQTVAKIEKMVTQVEKDFLENKFLSHANKVIGTIAKHIESEHKQLWDSAQTSSRLIADHPHKQLWEIAQETSKSIRPLSFASALTTKVRDFTRS